MSRTRKRNSATSPIRKYVSFSGSTGMINYYDKSRPEGDRSVELEKLDIIVLDTKASISGFSEAHQGGILSNMVGDISKEPFKVVAFSNGKPQDVAEGLYKDIRPTIKDAGGKYTTNVIAMADLGDGMEMVDVQLFGAALNSWIDFTKDNPNDSYYDNVVELSKGVLSKRGGKDKGNVPVTKKEEKELDAKLKKNPRAPRPVWFYVLNVELGKELTEEQAEMATEQDETLQAYFDETLGKKDDDSDSTEAESETSESPEPAENPLDEEEEDDLPF